VLQGGLSDETLAGRCQRTRHFGGATGVRALPQPLRAWAGKAIAPLAQGGRGQGERGGDGWQALTFDHVAPGLGTAADARFLGLLSEGV
jgi:hypothetical protein